MAKISIFEGIDEHWRDLENNIYLHTLKTDYDYVKSINPYQKVQVKIQDKIWDILIQQQLEREMECYRILGISASDSMEGAKKLAKWVQTGGGFNEFLDKSNNEIRNMIGDLVTQAISESDYDLNTNASAEVLSNVYDQVEQILNKKLDTLYGDYDENIVRKFAERGRYNLEAAKDISGALRKYDQKRKSLIYDNLDTYVNSLKQSSALSDFKGFALENAITIGLSTMFGNLKNTKAEIHTSGKELVKGKQQKADNILSVHNEAGVLQWGMSMKNYPISRTGRVNIKLQDESSLQNFLTKIQGGAILNNQAVNELQKAGRDFDTNNFKYHLINETLFNHYDINNTEPGKNVLELIKQAMFYFIGSEFLKAPEVVNNDFMVIGTNFIPVSDIMRNIGNLKVNYNPRLKKVKPLKESISSILEKKRAESVETSSDYYGNKAMHEGSSLGRDMWKTIQLNRIMMSLNIKDYI